LIRNFGSGRVLAPSRVDHVTVSDRTVSAEAVAPLARGAKA
jgi:hypothetical protein